MKKIFYSVFAFLVAAVVGNVAFADHNGAVVLTEGGNCNETTILASVLDSEGTHLVDNMYLVVEDPDGVQDELIPVDGTEAMITVGPYGADTTVYWRVFGGGERDYDQPLWNHYGDADFTTLVNDYITENGDEWLLAGMDDTNPFTTWESLLVEGCDEDDDGVANDMDCDPSDPENSVSADSKACQLYMSGVGGQGILSAPGLMSPFNPDSMAPEKAGKKN